MFMVCNLLYFLKYLNRMDLREVGCGCVDWMGLVAQDRDRWHALVSAVMNLWVP